jgi:hypothetical protein
VVDVVVVVEGKGRLINGEKIDNVPNGKGCLEMEGSLWK